jgi:hypothetical protein
MFAWTAVLKLQSPKEQESNKQCSWLLITKKPEKKRKKKDKRCNGSYNKIPQREREEEEEEEEEERMIQQ